VTTPRPAPPLAPDELVAAGTEREVLEAFLDFHREVLVRKVSGVSEQEARHRRVPSKTTLAGLVKHMIEEIARHVGHADILREQTDGAAGVDG
jgi:thermostable 8-oxoguanine DNA glycosylase